MSTSSALTIATPVRSGPYLFFTQFWAGSMMMRFNEDRPAASVVWKRGGKSPFPDETDALHSQNTTPSIIDDHIYGVDSYGELRALDLPTGERLWTSDQMTVQSRWGGAFMVKNGDRFFVNNDAGFLMIAQFTPEGYVEVDRTRLIEPTTSVGYGARRSFDRLVNWSHPAYANQHIIVRNDHEIVRASLAKEENSPGALYWRRAPVVARAFRPAWTNCDDTPELHRRCPSRCRVYRTRVGRAGRADDTPA